MGLFLIGGWAGDGEFELSFWNGDACELGELFLGDVEGEEGGGGGFDFAAEAFGDAVALGAAAGGEEEAIAVHDFPISQLHFEFRGFGFNLANGGNSGAGFDANACVRCGELEAIDDGGGVVGGGKHATVGFGLEGHAAIVEPADGVAGLEAGEGAAESFAAARVVLNQFVGVEAAVGDVAASTTGDADFSEDLLGGFEDGDAAGGVGLGDGDRAKKSSCTAADDDYVVISHKAPFRSAGILNHYFLQWVTGQREFMARALAGAGMIGLRRSRWRVTFLQSPIVLRCS